MYVEGKDVVPDVWEVLDKIRDFSGKLGTAAAISPWTLPCPSACACLLWLLRPSIGQHLYAPLPSEPGPAQSPGCTGKHASAAGQPSPP